MRSRVISSSAPNGSSMSRIRGSNESARAIATRCCMPPDSWYGMCLVNSPSSTRSSISFARFARQSLRLAQDLERQLDVVLDAPPVEQDRAPGTPCRSRGPAGAPARGLAVDDDRRRAVGWTRSPMTRSSVDLPQPDGPMSETNSPGAMSRSIPWSATVRPPSRVGEHLVDAADAGRRRLAVRSWAVGSCGHASTPGRPRRTKHLRDPDRRGRTRPRGSPATKIAAHSFSGPVA